METDNKQEIQSLMGTYIELMYQHSKKNDEPMKLNIELRKLQHKDDEPEYLLEFEDYDAEETFFRISIREWFELKAMIEQLVYNAISDRCLDSEIKLREM